MVAHARVWNGAGGPEGLVLAVAGTAARKGSEAETASVLLLDCASSFVDGAAEADSDAALGGVDEARRKVCSGIALQTAELELGPCADGRRRAPRVPSLLEPSRTAVIDPPVLRAVLYA